MTRTTLCTVAQVLQTAGYNHEDEVGGADVVNEFIEEAEAEVSGDWGDPIKNANFILDSNNTRYEFRNDNKETYRIDLILIREDDNDRRVYTEVASGDDPSEASQTYSKDFEFNTITLASETVSARDGSRVEITYVPAAFHHLVRLKAALSLIDKTNVMNAEEGMPAIAIRLMSRVKRLEKALTDAVAVGSEDEINYDPTLGDTIPQRRFWIS